MLGVLGGLGTAGEVHGVFWVVFRAFWLTGKPLFRLQAEASLQSRNCVRDTELERKCDVERVIAFFLRCPVLSYSVQSIFEERLLSLPG